MSHLQLRNPARRLWYLAGVALIILAGVGLIAPAPAPAYASGSRSFANGFRPFIEWHNTATSGGIPRKTTIKAYVAAGEQIFLGSSAMGYGQGDIVFRSPDDPSNPNPPITGTCRGRNGGNAGYGRIATYAQEQAGPLPAPGGYTPCVITGAETTSVSGGIWEFDFISPNPNASIRNDPAPIAATADWSINRPADQQNFWIAAWDVSVRDSSGANTIPGRVFANYLAFNLGGNATTSGPLAGLGLDTDFFILTYDGYEYRIDMNGIDPFGFIFFSNSEGIVDARGNPIYRSLQLVGVPPNVALPPGYGLHLPGNPDNFAQNQVTHKLFFEPPNDENAPGPDLPENAFTPSGETWLLRPVEQPPTATNFRFTGVEGTPGQMGTNPLGGTFTFEAPPNTSYVLTIDTNRNGVFGDTTAAGTDRILSGSTTPGLTSAYWDGLDGAGAVVPAGSAQFNAQVQLFAGEVHFPFIDAENNPRGMILERIRPAFQAGDPDPFRIYYNDAYTYDPATSYDYSVCTGDDTPPPPAAAIGAGPSDPVCYGTPVDSHIAPNGTTSRSGAHAWTYENIPGRGPSRGMGDRRLIDTWAYYPSIAASLTSQIVLAESELSILKTSTPNPLTPGAPMEYLVTVTNGGPSDVVGARVVDTIPAAMLNVTWQCTITSGSGRCADPSGAGNNIDTTVDLTDQSVATFRIRGTLSPSAEGSLENIATVGRPNDVNDPDPGNNASRNVTPIATVADLELTKSIQPPPPSGSGAVTFNLELRNRGPAAATNVEVTDRLPAGLTFVSATASHGSYDGASGRWQIARLAPGEVALLQLTVTWDGRDVVNTAEVTRSDQRDPDSTPNNNDPSEDDQSSAALPIRVIDLELTKRVSVPRVNVGQNAIFTIELLNRGPGVATATGVRVSDRLPVGLAFVGATASQGSYNPVSGNWTVGSLAPGARATLAIEVTVLEAGPFTNIAQVSAANEYDRDSTPNNDDATEDDQGFAVLAGDIADLSVSKGVNDSQPPFGGRIIYTVKVDNAGPSTATGIEITDELPVGLSLVAQRPSQGSYNPTTGLWVVGTLAPGASATLRIEADVTTGATLVNTAELTAADQPDPDSTPNNNNPGEDDQASVALTPQVADLELSKRVNTPAPPIGGEVTFTIELFNRGPSRATGVQVSEPLPDGLIYVSHVAGQGSYNPASGAWEVGDLALGATTTLSIRARLAAIGPYTNTAQVSKSDQFDPDSTPNNSVPGEDDQASVTITAASADLSVSKTATANRPAPDGTITYVVGAFNAGPSTATNVALAERLPPGSVFVGAQTSQGSYDSAASSWAIGTLLRDSGATLTLTVRLTGRGPYVNVAEISASDQPDPDSTPNNNNPNEDDQASFTVGLGSAPASADLELEKTARAVPSLPNGVAFILTLVNKGPDTATGVAVEDRLPPGLRFENAAPSQGVYDPATGAWTVGTLPRDGVATLTIFAVLTTNDAVTNTAQVSRSDQFDPDSTPNNNNPNEDDQDSVTVSIPTAIDLIDFRAERAGEGVLVRWTTGLERGTLGFHLYRSADGSRAGAARITPGMIPATGGLTGASYTFPDTTAEPGTRYTYWLVEVAEGDTTSEYGPVASEPALSGAGTRIYLPLLAR